MIKVASDVHFKSFGQTCKNSVRVTLVSFEKNDSYVLGR